MPLLGNPYIANVPRQMSADELSQAIRVDIMGEYDAIIGYEAHAASTNDDRIKKILYHIADEEKQHIGELEQILFMLSPQDGEYVEKGKQVILNQQAQNFQGQIN